MKIKFMDLLHKPFLDEFEGGGGAAGAEVTETADPSVNDDSQGAEATETAELSTGKTDADARFAEMRRELEQAKKDLADSSALNEELENALGNFFQGDTDQKIVAANALATGKTEDEIRAEIEAENERERLVEEKEELSNRVLDLETQQKMENDLRELQKIDPNIKSLDDIGSDFLDYIAAGLDAKLAYYAFKAKKNAESAVAPEEVGAVNQSTGPKDFYTREEVKAMSQEEVHKNYDVIRKSMSQW